MTLATGGPILRSMTDLWWLEGGLDEPDRAASPSRARSALASPRATTYDAADWETAAAAVLRKARRLARRRRPTPTSGRA